MNFVSKDIFDCIIKISNSCSKDETRPHLHNVHICKLDDGGIEIVATDGFILSKRQFVNPELSAFLPENGISINKKDIKHIKVLLKNNKFKHTFKIRLEDYYLFIEDLKIVLSQREYIAYKLVTNIVIKNKLEIKLDPKLIKRLSDSMNVDKNDGLVFQINLDNPLSPIIVFDDTNIKNTGMIMPIKRSE